MFNLETIVSYIFVIAYIVMMTAIAVIDKKYTRIDKKILTGGVVVSIFYMLYLYIVKSYSIYWNIMYLGIYVILLTIDTFLLRRYAKDSYIIKILMLLNIILIYVDTEMTVYTMMIAGLATLIYIFLVQIEYSRKGNKKLKLEEVPVGFFIGAGNIIALFIVTFIKNWVNQ